MTNVPPGEQPPGGGWQPPPPPPSGGWQQQQPPGGYGQQPPPGAYQPPQPGYQQQPAPVGPGGQPLAEWWKRLVAWIIDYFIVAVPLGILFAIFGISFERSVEYDVTSGQYITTSTGSTATLLVWLLAVIAPLVYRTVLDGGARGQTVGKRALKIQVRDVQAGGPIGMGRASVRVLIQSLLFAACFIPGIIDSLSPLWDARRQSWHDKVGSSVVVDV
ncbi:MAG: RDD family protein [Actinomycetota bacterium]|nr:RDD family protein [Actinomycetota bacterium]MDQ3574567.1 RDD family protein [Actinomycetota bacterium]